MPQPPLPSPNRLNKLEKTHARARRVFFIWKDPGDTPADVEAKRDRLIARERRARTTNSFTSVGAARTKRDARLAPATRHSGAAQASVRSLRKLGCACPRGRNPAYGCRSRPPGRFHCFRIVIYNEPRNLSVSRQNGGRVAAPRATGAATHACPLTSRCHESGIVLRYGPRESQRERAQDVAAWAYLIVAGLCEIGWPIGLKWTQQPGWTVLGAAMAVISLAISGGLLFLAQRDISLGTSYAVWTGIGAAGTFLVGVWFFGDPSSFGRWLGAALIIAGVITLKLAH